MCLIPCSYDIMKTMITFRPIGIFLSKIVTKIIKLKHKPNIIVVTGSGETSLVRELLYSAIKEIEPTRRNLEKPEAEFSIPLTIFGEYSYPRTKFIWLILFFKTILRLFYIKPYQHTLIVEINSFNQKIYERWIPILAPSTIFVVGNIHEQIKDNSLEVITINQSEDFINNAIEIISIYTNQKYNCDKNLIRERLENSNLPQSKINFAKSPMGNIVLDASYFQFAPSAETVSEIVSIFPNDKKIIGEIPKSWAKHDLIKNLKQIKNFNEAEREDLIILVGPRNKVVNLRRNLFI